MIQITKSRQIFMQLGAPTGWTNNWYGSKIQLGKRFSRSDEVEDLYIGRLIT